MSTLSTYTHDPATSPVDAVRFLLGDTDTSRFELTDAEINWTLGQKNQNRKAAAAFLAHQLAARHAHSAQSVRLPDFQISRSGRDVAANYRAIAARLERELAADRGDVYAGGTSKADKDSVEEDADRDSPTFRRGLHDYQAPSQPRTVDEA